MAGDNPFAATNGAPLAAVYDISDDVRTPAELTVPGVLWRCVEIFEENVGVVLAAILIPAVVAISVAMFGAVFDLILEITDDKGLTALLRLGQLMLQLVSFVIQTWLSLGVIRAFLNLARGHDASVEMIFGEAPNLLSAMGATVLQICLVLSGLLLFFVPGVVLATGLAFVLFAVVDKDLGPMAALRESWRLTNGSKLWLFSFNVAVFFAVGALACATCCFGYLAALPLLSLCQAVIYQSLQHRVDGYSE